MECFVNMRQRAHKYNGNDIEKNLKQVQPLHFTLPDFFK